MGFSRRGSIEAPVDPTYLRSSPFHTEEARTAMFSKDRIHRMHDVLARHVGPSAVPGLVALVSRGGEVHVVALGTLALDGKVAVARDSIFRIASMTKPVTAVAALLLVE